MGAVLKNRHRIFTKLYSFISLPIFASVCNSVVRIFLSISSLVGSMMFFLKTSEAYRACISAAKGKAASREVMQIKARRKLYLGVNIPLYNGIYFPFFSICITSSEKNGKLLLYPVHNIIASTSFSIFPSSK